MLGIILTYSCSEKKLNESDIKDQVLTTYNEMYNSYGEGTDEFWKYFENGFLRVTPSGNFQKGVEEQKTKWNDYLKVKELHLESFDAPEMIISEKQVITVGGYVEYFIDRATKDSSYNRGVYVATWRKNDNGDWKICMDTWHSGLDEK
jgi:ketosteroid isomerase-like protein